MCWRRHWSPPVRRPGTSYTSRLLRREEQAKARATRRFADGIARGLALAAVAGCLVLPRQAKAQAILAGPPEMQTVTLKGTVLGPDGQPVPEAQIGVITTPRFQTLDQLFSGKCNQAGEFEVVTPDLTQYYGPRAACCVLARGADGTLVGAGTAVTGDPSTPVQIRLQASGHIHSSILDPKGQPVAGMGTLVMWKAEHVPGAAEGSHADQIGEVLIGPLPAGLQVGVGVAYELRHPALHNTWDRKGITLQPGETCELPPLILDPEGRAVKGTLSGAGPKR